MDIKGIRKILGHLKPRTTKMAGGKYMYASCPMAPFSDGHKNAIDANPAFWVMINDNGSSVCGCWACGIKAMPFVKFLEELNTKRNGDLVETINYARSHELPYSGKAAIAEAKKLIQYDYTPMYAAAYLQDLDVMPWEWLASKGVHKRSADAFKIGLDIHSGSVIFPAITRDGKIAGAQSRPISAGASEQKYSTILKFQSTNYLFGLHLFGENPEFDGEASVFEGPLDVMHCYEEDVPNPLGMFGSSLHEGQIALLKELGVVQLNLMQDPDAAGQKGVTLSLEKIKEFYPSLYVRTPKLSADPKKMSAQQFKQTLESGDVKCQELQTADSLMKTMDRMAQKSTRRPRQ